MKFLALVGIIALIWLVGLFAFAERVRGFTPTPGRPILPVSIARLAIAITVVEPWLCSVTPRP